MTANTKTIAFLLFTLCTIVSMVNGQALSIKTPSPSTSPLTNAPIMTPKGSSAPVAMFGKGGKGSKLGKKTTSPAMYKYSKLAAASGKASKLSASKGMSGKAGKAGKGMTLAPVAP